MASNRRDTRFILFELGPEAYKATGLIYLLSIYFGSMVFSALVSPWVYHGIVALAEVWPIEMLEYLAGKGYEDYFDRLRWVPVLAFLPWVLKRCGLFSLERLGVRAWPESRGAFFRSFALGAGIVLLCAVLQKSFASVSWREAISFQGFIFILIKAMAGGLLLGLLEETVFRGLVFRVFYTAMRPAWAVGLGAAFFAYTHFKMPDFVWQEAGQAVQWHSGFFVMFWTVLGIFRSFDFIAFFNLFLLGVFLIRLFQRTASLWPCIGFHAGIVTVMLTFKNLVRHHADAFAWFWGAGKLVDGVLVSILLGVLLLWNSSCQADADS